MASQAGSKASGNAAGAGSAMQGFGMFMQGLGNAKSMYDAADAERRNAKWFREQGQFAKEAGQRQLDVFDDQSKILVGDQLSAFAKAGVDTGASAWFIANTELQRQKEHGAIKFESDFNVRAANMRALEADRSAHNMDFAGDVAMISSVASLGSLI